MKNQKLSITDEIIISNQKDFYSGNEAKKQEALRFSVESWYGEKNKVSRDGMLQLAKTMNDLEKRPLTAEDKRTLGKKGVENVMKNGFIPIETIEISVIPNNQ